MAPFCVCLRVPSVTDAGHGLDSADEVVVQGRRGAREHIAYLGGFIPDTITASEEVLGLPPRPIRTEFPDKHTMLGSLGTPEMNGRPRSATAHVTTPHEGRGFWPLHATPTANALTAVRTRLPILGGVL